MFEKIKSIVIGVTGGIVSVSSPRVRRLNDVPVYE